MQRLEVSCVVRLIYTSLGAKGLKQTPNIPQQQRHHFLSGGSLKSRQVGTRLDTRAGYTRFTN